LTADGDKKAMWLHILGHYELFNKLTCSELHRPQVSPIWFQCYIAHVIEKACSIP
jgi:hypothetical protein